SPHRARRYAVRGCRYAGESIRPTCPPCARDPRWSGAWAARRSTSRRFSRDGQRPRRFLSTTRRVFRPRPEKAGPANVRFDPSQTLLERHAIAEADGEWMAERQVAPLEVHG